MPNSDALFSTRTICGRYLLARRLRQARFTTLAADVEQATALVKQAGRALEDAEQPIQDFIADRDGFDGDLDFAAQSERKELAGRSLDAVRTEPYKSPFDKGIGYDLAAPLDQENARYRELVARSEAHLPADDQLRIATVKALTQGLEGFNEAVRQLEDARVQYSVLATRLANAVEAWDRQVEKTYGALVVELGAHEPMGSSPVSAGGARKGLEPPAPVTDTHGWAPTPPRTVVPGTGKPSARFKAGGRWPGASTLTRKRSRPGGQGSDLRPSRTFPSGSGRESSTCKRPRRGRGGQVVRVPNERPRRVPPTAARSSRLGCLVEPGFLA